MSSSNNNLNNLNSQNKVKMIKITKNNFSDNQTNNNKLLFTTKIKKNKSKEKSSHNSYEKIVKDIASEVKKINQNNITEYKQNNELQIQNHINPFTLINNNNNNYDNNDNNNINNNNDNNDNNNNNYNNDNNNNDKDVNNIFNKSIAYKKLIKKIANQLKIKTHPPKNKIFIIQKQPQINEIFKTDCIKSSKSKQLDYISPQYSKEKLITEYFYLNNNKKKDKIQKEILINNELAILENKLNNSNFVENFDKFLEKNLIISNDKKLSGFGMECRDYFINEKFWELELNYIIKKYNIDLDRYFNFAQNYINEYCLNIENYEKFINFIFEHIQNNFSKEIINSFIHKSGYKIIEFSKDFLDDYFNYKKNNIIKINNKYSKLTINNEQKEKISSSNKKKINNNNNENIQFYRNKIIENYKDILDISNYNIQYVKFKQNNDSAITETNNNNINNINDEVPLQISIKTNAEIQNIKLDTSDEKCLNLEIENNIKNERENNLNENVKEEEEKNNECEKQNKIEEKCYLKISYGKSSKRKNYHNSDINERETSKIKRKPWKP